MTNGTSLAPVPYASPQNVLQLITRYRDRGLPKPLTKADVEAMGIKTSNAYRSLQTLKFLGLLSEDGYPTDRFDMLKRASNDAEYKAVLAEAVREAYSTVLQIVDPEQDSVDTIQGAFRRYGYEPVSELPRMVNLFLALCYEAGIVSEEKRPKQAPARAQQRATTPRRPVDRNPEERGNNGSAREDITPPPPRNDPPRRESSTGDIPEQYRLLVELLRTLPKDGQWSTLQRKKWLGAMSSAIDVVVEVSDDPEIVSIEPPRVSQPEGNTSW